MDKQPLGQVIYGHGNAFALTAAMGTTPQLIKSGRGQIGVVFNNQNAAQTSSVTIYDAGATDSGTLAASNKILDAAVLQAQSAAAGRQQLDIPFANGLVIVASAAITGIIWVSYD